MKLSGDLDRKNLVLLSDESVMENLTHSEQTCVVADDEMRFGCIAPDKKYQQVTAIFDNYGRYDQYRQECSLLLRLEKKCRADVKLGQTYGDSLKAFFNANGSESLLKLTREAWKYPLDKQIKDWDKGYGYLDSDLIADKKETIIQRMIYYYSMADSRVKKKMEAFLENKFGLETENVKALHEGLLSKIAAEDKNDGNRHDYYKLFEKFLPGICIDALTERLVYFNDTDKWESAMNQTDWLEAEASDLDLKPAMVKRWLANYGREKAVRKLLIDEKQWDGVDRIKQISDCVHIKEDSGLTREHFDEYIRQSGAKIYERLQDNNVQNELLLLVGPQGLGKDELIKAMFGSFGRYYAEGTIGRNENDDYQLANMSLVINLSEFDQTARTDVGYLKDFITKSRVTLRKPYAREPEELLLHHSLVASSNEPDLLRDSTGNRRFVIFEIEKIDWNYPRDEGLQILAQFRALQGYRVNKETKDAMRAYIDRKTPETLEDKVIEVFDNIMHGEFMPATARNDVAQNVIKSIMNILKLSHGRVCAILTKNGRSRKGSGNIRELYLPGDAPPK